MTALIVVAVWLTFLTASTACWALIGYAHHRQTRDTSTAEALEAAHMRLWEAEVSS